MEEIEEDEQELDGQPLTAAEVLRQCAVLSGEHEQPDPEYPVGVCEVPSSAGLSIRVAVICIGESAGSFLVAAPHVAWHRTVVRQQLPSSFSSKPICM